MPPPTPVITLDFVVKPGDTSVARDLLAERSGLSKTAVKDAMKKGAAWLRRSKAGAKRRRFRRATATVRPGDRVELFYDPKVLDRLPPRARLIEDFGEYSGWFKPPGLLSQGSDFGDHCALLRQAEQELAPRSALLIHRLDREAAGIMLVAHASTAAGALSALFREGRIEKVYRVQVRGRVDGEGSVDTPLDGKPAVTEFRALAHDAASNTSTLEVRTHTGRRHQIRRHLEAAGFPVMGDPRYGQSNRNRAGMRLAATGLSFRCPVLRRTVTLALADEELEF